MYVKLLDGSPSKFPYNLGELKKDAPNTSFPDPISETALADYGVYPVTPTPAPSCDSKTHRLTQWVEEVDGAWTQTWELLQLPEERAATNVRAERNRLLADCDWTQLADAPVDSAAWAAYRQELRDITSQAGFPWDVQWPTEPGAN
jgi:hypothetical protein